MNDLRNLFERQAAWQKARARLSWSEKIRQAAVLRDALLTLRRTRPSQLKTGKDNIVPPKQARG